MLEKLLLKQQLGNDNFCRCYVKNIPLLRPKSSTVATKIFHTIRSA